MENAKETAELVKKMTEQEKRIKDNIMKIERPYQEILFNKYILDKTIAEISVIIHYSYEQTKRKLKKANKMYINMTQDDLE